MKKEQRADNLPPFGFYRDFIRLYLNNDSRKKRTYCCRPAKQIGETKMKLECKTCGIHEIDSKSLPPIIAYFWSTVPTINLKHYLFYV